MLIPVVIEHSDKGERSWDIYSRLLKERIIFIDREIEPHLSSVVVAQLLYLDSEGLEDITLYINSPGGSIKDGLAIIDTMKLVKSDVSTVCLGEAASMGAMILSQGTKGKRFILQNADVMIHQASGGFRGKTTDAKVNLQRQIELENRLFSMLAEVTEKDIETIRHDCNTDKWLNANEAIEYGLVDKIIGN